MKKLVLQMSLVLGCLCSLSPAFALSPPADECQVDADCAAQERCVVSPQTCVEWPEPGNEVCFTSRVCEPAGPVQCTSDADCAADQHCAMMTPLCTPCAFIDEDGDGQNDIECPACDPIGLCSPAPQPTGCNADADCQDGMVCAMTQVCDPCPFIDEDGDGQSDLQCENSCRSEGMCLIPVPNCTTDADCADGLVCQLAYPSCPACPFIDEDGDGQSDIDCAPCPPPTGSCTAPPAQCITDADCPEGQACFQDLGVDCPECPFIDEDGDGQSDIQCEPCLPPMGICGELPPENPICFADSDCEPGQRCQLEDFECPTCPFIDEDGDGQSDINCAPCAPSEGYCIDEVTQPIGCLSDAECGAGERCELSTVCADCAAPVDGDEPSSDCGGCFTEGYCVATSQPIGCSSNADCSADEECVFDVVCEQCSAVDIDGSGAVGDSCGDTCEERAACQPRQVEPEHNLGDDVVMQDDSIGHFFGCQSTRTQAGSPATLSLVLMGFVGMLLNRRRRRRA